MRIVSCFAAALTKREPRKGLRAVGCWSSFPVTSRQSQLNGKYWREFSARVPSSSYEHPRPATAECPVGISFGRKTHMRLCVVFYIFYSKVDGA